jgi:hypothetical protein
MNLRFVREPWVPHPLRPTTTHAQTGLIADAKGGIPHRRRTTSFLVMTFRFRIHAEKYHGTTLKSHKVSGTVMATKMKRRRRDHKLAQYVPEAH